MKHALKLIVTYFVFLILCILFGTFLYTIFQNAVNFTAGSDINFFQPKILLASLIKVTYSSCFLICPFIAIYRVRHIHGGFQTASYILVCVFTWFVIFPVNYFLETKVSDYIASDDKQILLSSNFFRETDDKIYYITKDFEQVYKNYEVKDVSQVVVMDKSEEGKVSYETIEHSDDMDMLVQAKPYKEVGIKSALNVNKMFQVLGINTLTEKAKDSFKGGFFSYLQFLSIALLLASLYGVSYFFDWRLMNTYAIFITTVFILFANITFYLPVSQNFRNYINHFRFFSFLQNYIYEPFLFIMNNLFGVIFIVAGVIKCILHHVKEKQ